MDFIFNEQSISELNSKQEAAKKYKTFLDTCIETLKYRCFKEQNRILIEKNKDIKLISLHKDYLLIKWIDRLPRRDIRKNILLKMLSSHYKPIIASEYYFNNKKTLGLAYAYKHKMISISFNTPEWSNCFMEITDLEKKEKKKIVKNISSIEHINCHKRIFRHHKKHNKNNPAKNESPLLYNHSDCDDIKIIENLLNCAIPVKASSKILCFFDMKINKFIKFYPESRKKGTNENYFHAFHIDNETEIPEVTRKRIKEIINKN